MDHILAEDIQARVNEDHNPQDKEQQLEDPAEGERQSAGNERAAEEPLDHGLFA